MDPFEKHLREIDSWINVTQADRQPFTTMFDNIRTTIIREMRLIDRVFDRLCVGTCLFGSYTNGVRLVKPNEFDVLIALKFPFNSFEVPLDEDRPGFVHFDMTDTLEDMEDDYNYQEVYEKVQQLVDYKTGYLRRTNLRSWISDLIETAVARKNDIFRYHYQYKVTDEKHAVAHTIYAHEVYYPNKKISIDFVPAIDFGKVDAWMHIRRYPPFKDDYYYSFYGVPKNSKNKPRDKSGLYTFLLVNPMAEHELLWDKKNLKSVFRLLKSLRDCYNLRRLKSYFLTTVFLWEVQRRNTQFWEYSVSYIFLCMLGKLCDYFNNRNLPYFWVKNYNLLDILKPEEITEYGETLNSVFDTLNTYPDQPLLSCWRVTTHFKLPE